MSTSVTGTCQPARTSGTNGLCRMCAVASAADRVMVMMNAVATNPSRNSTSSLPRQPGSSRSSIASEPSPWGLCSATAR